MTESEFLQAIEDHPTERENYLVYADWLDEAGQGAKADQMRRQSFLAPLKLDEDDEVLRSAYANWLETRGEYEEADRQRQWPSSKQWMSELAATLPRESWSEDEDRPYTYEELMECFGPLASHRFDEHLTIHFGSDESAMYQMYDHLDTFLIHWSVLTGQPLAELDSSKIGFHCAC